MWELLETATCLPSTCCCALFFLYLFNTVPLHSLKDNSQRLNRRNRGLVLVYGWLTIRAHNGLANVLTKPTYMVYNILQNSIHAKERSTPWQDIQELTKPSTKPFAQRGKLRESYLRQLYVCQVHAAVHCLTIWHTMGWQTFSRNQLPWFITYLKSPSTRQSGALRDNTFKKSLRGPQNPLPSAENCARDISDS